MGGQSGLRTAPTFYWLSVELVYSLAAGLRVACSLQARRLKVRRRFPNTSAEESAAAATADWPKLFLHPKTETLNCRWDAG